jgi:outer membrane protein, adhesin transport system
MPVHRRADLSCFGVSLRFAMISGLGLLMLGGCLQAPVQMRTQGNAAGGVGAENVMARSAAGSALIRDLQSRNSVLPKGGPFANVAEAVLAASQGAAAAELRVAQLRAQARAKNWLPQVGPSVSLNSLAGLVASLTINQPILDNGRRKAERDFAAADVEVAAVGLSQDMNQRVFEGLRDYINLQRAQAQADVARRAAARLSEFDTLMKARVQGGLSDMSEQQVIAQRIAENEATLAADEQAAIAAAGQLAALMGGQNLPISGIDTLRDMRAGPPALSVLRQQGEGARAIAQANLTRADMLPGLTAGASITQDGADPGLRLTGLGMLNPGSASSMQALAQTATIVERKNAEAAATAQRRILALAGDIDMLSTRAVRGQKVLEQTEANLELFTQQYQLGRRSLLELVSQYDAFSQLERDQTALRFDIALRSIEIARDLGLLVSGARL